MKTIVLLGELGKRFGRRHELDVASPAEAVRALCAVFEGFREFVATSHERNVAYRVISGRDDVDVEELHYPAGSRVIIAPVIGGAGGTLGRIVLGVVLVAAAFATGGMSLTATGLVAGSLAGQIAFGIGISLALGGIAQMLAPQPKTPDNKNDASYVFDGPVNTVSQGYPVPVGYGRMIVGSAIISAGITAVNI